MFSPASQSFKKLLVVPVRRGAAQVRCFSVNNEGAVDLRKLMGESLQPPAGRLWTESDNTATNSLPLIGARDVRDRKRVLVLCTGGTLTMAPDPQQGGALAPVQGALSRYMKNMTELKNNDMPEVVLHEYTPFVDSSDLGPADWARLASDIEQNYLHFDGFVVVTGTKEVQTERRRVHIKHNTPFSYSINRD
jgi:hypothetical protein